jgi:hypothetical protein
MSRVDRSLTGDPKVLHPAPARKKNSGQGALATRGNGWANIATWPLPPVGTRLRPSQKRRIEREYGIAMDALEP